MENATQPSALPRLAISFIKCVSLTRRDGGTLRLIGATLKQSNGSVLQYPLNHISLLLSQKSSLLYLRTVWSVSERCCNQLSASRSAAPHIALRNCAPVTACGGEQYAALRVSQERMRCCQHLARAGQDASIGSCLPIALIALPVVTPLSPLPCDRQQPILASASAQRSITTSSSWR